MPFDGPNHHPDKHPWGEDPEDMRGRRNATGGIAEGLAASILVIVMLVVACYLFRYFWSL